MSLLLYRFDSVKDFPVLESYTTARGSISSRVEDSPDGPVLRIAVEGHAEDPSEATVAIALPLVAVDGEPDQLVLTVEGDASCGRLELDASDAGGAGMSYSFGRIDFAGRRACCANVRKPDAIWNQGGRDNTPQVTLPLQLHRLRIQLDPSVAESRFGLVDLSVTGKARRGTSGIATCMDL